MSLKIEAFTVIFSHCSHNMGQPRYDADTETSTVATLRIFTVWSRAMLKARGSGTVQSSKDFALRRYERVQGKRCNMDAVDLFDIRRVFSRIICFVWFLSKWIRLQLDQVDLESTEHNPPGRKKFLSATCITLGVDSYTCCCYCQGIIYCSTNTR